MRLPRKQRQHESSSKADQEESAVVFWWNRTSNLFTQHFYSKWNPNSCNIDRNGVNTKVKPEFMRRRRLQINLKYFQKHLSWSSLKQNKDKEDFDLSPKFECLNDEAKKFHSLANIMQHWWRLGSTAIHPIRATSDIALYLVSQARKIDTTLGLECSYLELPPDGRGYD
ncbi:unnamed protein product [Protopolystoma xenopodis]|uniref:Uncharacterized protein n=1 Tax=Protopolystoma xenopodis TaxID=117903 RepID=A0A448X3N6_9PLAT|nr:unnamed protein product [Protopolystoma xenopodis]